MLARQVFRLIKHFAVVALKLKIKSGNGHAPLVAEREEKLSCQIEFFRLRINRLSLLEHGALADLRLVHSLCSEFAVDGGYFGWFVYLLNLLRVILFG